MAQTMDGPEARDTTFHTFFDNWLVEQNQHLQELVLASKQETSPTVTQDDLNDRILRPLVARVIEHYEHYYRVKSRWAHNHVFTMFKPAWRSTLENCYIWIGGWRPTMAIHLLYTKSCLAYAARFGDGDDDEDEDEDDEVEEDEIDELVGVEGLNTGDLGDLSTTPLDLVNVMHMAVVREEQEITEKFAAQQETVAEPSMVKLSHAVTESMRAEGDSARHVVYNGRVERTLSRKEVGYVEVLQRADDLRLKTLKQLINILSPKQGVHFLIAAAELHLRVHEWGRKRDEKHRRAEENRRNQQN